MQFLYCDQNNLFCHQAFYPSAISRWSFDIVEYSNIFYEERLGTKDYQMDLAIIIFIIVPKSKFWNYFVFYSKLCEKSLRSHNRPAKLTLSSTLLQSSHNNYWKAWTWVKYKLCSKSAKSLSPGICGSQLLGKLLKIFAICSTPNTL